MIPASYPGTKTRPIGGSISSDVATAWIAMSPANKVSGCMKFVAGTHKQQVKHEDTFNQNNLLTRGQEIAVEVDESKAVFAELKPGQASLHHVLLFHGSEPNRSDDRRIGLAVRYIPTRLKQAVGQKGLGDAGARQGHGQMRRLCDHRRRAPGGTRHRPRAPEEHRALRRTPQGA